MPGADRAYVPVNLAAAGALVASALWYGMEPAEIGLATAGIFPGLVWGATLLAVIAGALTLATRLRTSRRLLEDKRVAGIGPRQLAYRTLVRIPLGTVVVEEVAFRGVLLGVWAVHASVPVAIAGSSVMFGLWHIGPTIRLLRDNELAPSAGRDLLAVAGSVASTAVAGAGLCLVTVWTGGIVAAAITHAAANSLATVAAFTVQRRGGARE